METRSHCTICKKRFSL